MKHELQKPRRFRFFTVVRMHLDSHGGLRSHTPLMSIDEWLPFLDVFDNVEVFARIDTSKPDESGYLLEHPRLVVRPLPAYSGVRSYIQQILPIRSFLRREVSDPSLVYGVWGPGPVAATVAKLVDRFDGLLLVRLIGDSEDVARAILPRPLGHIVGLGARFQTRRMVKRASAVIYVTLRSLQTKYPAKDAVPRLARTNLKLEPEIFAGRKVDYSDFLIGATPSIIAVGSQQQNYKGHDLLIDAVAELNRRGEAVDLTLVGQGALHSSLVSRAAERGLHVTFVHRAGTTSDVAALVSRHDIFVMPSRTEGMPKALLEAMAVGVFALGSSVGGIPEVLEPEHRFESNSSEAIVERLQYFLTHRDLVPRAVSMQHSKFVDIWENHSGPKLIKEFLTTWMNQEDPR